MASALQQPTYRVCAQCKTQLKSDKGVLFCTAQQAVGRSHCSAVVCIQVGNLGCVGSVEVAEFLRGCSDLYDVESETGFFKSLGASVVTAKQNME